MIFFRRADDQIHDIRETAATAAPFAHRMIDLGGNDELPTVIIKKLDDDVPDFPVGDVIAAADEHSKETCQNMTNAISFLGNKTQHVKKNSYRPDHGALNGKHRAAPERHSTPSHQ
jgi:hypothetical protein